MEITKQHIEEAHKRIKPFIHKTPVLTSKTIDQISGAEIFFKCENFQKIGAFKIRGGMNAVLSLPEEKRKKTWIETTLENGYKWFLRHVAIHHHSEPVLSKLHQSSI